jgi:hypothetical protein
VYCPREECTVKENRVNSVARQENEPEQACYLLFARYHYIDAQKASKMAMYIQKNMSFWPSWMKESVFRGRLIIHSKRTEQIVKEKN